MDKTIVLLVVFLGVFVAYSSQSPNGAPSIACSSITPGHGGSSGTLPGGYYIYSDLVDAGGSYEASTSYNIRLEGNADFRGFLIQARTAGTTTPIGTFNTPSGAKHLTCSSQSTGTVTHTSNNDKSSLEFTWTSPGSTGTVEFRYAVVKQNSGGINIYYANINAADFRPESSTSSSTNVPAPSTTTTTATTTTPSDTTSNTMMNPSMTSTAEAMSTSVISQSSSSAVMPTNSPSTCPSTNKNANSSFPIVFGTPDGCERSDCTYYWAMGPNNEDSSYVDIYLEGNVNGWIAVGFSENKQMTMTDVLGCRVVSGSNVEAIDTWNEPTNGIDDSQDGVCTHTTNYDGQRLKCLFSRNSAALNAGQDFDLDNSLYIIRGYRTTANSGSSFNKHSTTPRISTEQYNVLKDTNTGPTSPPTGQQGCPLAPAADANYATELNAPGADYYFGARVNDDNSSYLDITLESVADGWVAIGFSDSNNMFSSDVFGCKREESGDNVNVIDAWNPSGARTNLIDDTQSGICQHTTEYTDGRIKCTFSRLIDPSNIGQDLNLNDTLYQIYNAISSNRGSSDSGLGPHSKIPTLSENKMSLATDALTGRQLEATEWPKKPLIQTHGVFMIISWILLAGTGIFFASWMKPTLPNGEWFQAHRALMVASLFAGVIGFIFAFIAHVRNTEVAGIINFSEPNRGIKIVHFVFGWVIILFHISNPIIAIFRCAPGKPKRWIFNLIHGHLVGLIVFLIAVANVGMGIFLIEKSQSSYDTPRALILYAVFIAVLLCLQLILFIVYTIKGMKAPEEDRPKLVHSLLRYCIGGVAKESQKMQMTDLDKEKKQSDEKPPRKQPHKDAPVTISWISAALHMVLTVVVVLILIVLIAIL